jgi:hypothetical protein
MASYGLTVEPDLGRQVKPGCVQLHSIGLIQECVVHHHRAAVPPIAGLDPLAVKRVPAKERLRDTAGAQEIEVHVARHPSRNGLPGRDARPVPALGIAHPRPAPGQSPEAIEVNLFHQSSTSRALSIQLWMAANSVSRSRMTSSESTLMIHSTWSGICATMSCR